MQKKIFFVLMLLTSLQLLFTACQKNYEPMVEGIWEEVIVGDIDSDYLRDWHFVENEIHVYRYHKDSPMEQHEVESGRYIMRNTIQGLFMRMAEMRDNRFNNDWEVLKLEKERMVISLEIPGEVIYREFIKKQAN